MNLESLAKEIISSLGKAGRFADTVDAHKHNRIGAAKPAAKSGR